MLRHNYDFGLSGVPVIFLYDRVCASTFCLIHEYFLFFSELFSWFDCFSELSSQQLTFSAVLLYIPAYGNPLSSAFKQLAKLLELLVIICLTPNYSW